MDFVKHKMEHFISTRPWVGTRMQQAMFSAFVELTLLRKTDGKQLIVNVIEEKRESVEMYGKTYKVD